MRTSRREFIRDASLAVGGAALAGITGGVPEAFAQGSSVAIPAPCPVTLAELGYNMQDSFENLSAAEMLKPGGATIVRWQPGWNSVEAYGSNTYSLDSATEGTLAYCGANGIKPIAVCGYGPPYDNVLDLTVGPAGAAAGAYEIPIIGSVTSIVTPLDYVTLAGSPPYPQVTDRWAYYGSLIASVDTTANTITLASALTTNLAANQTLLVWRLKYAALADQSVTNPGLVAYFNYVEFVASRLAANNCTGWCALWNEMPWGPDRWDAQGAFYDTPPQGMNTDSTGKVFLEYALTISNLPAGVRLINGMSDNTGGNSMLWSGLSPTTTTVSENVSVESIHPYGNLPDGICWDPLDVQNGNSYTYLNPAVDDTANFAEMAYMDTNANIGLTIMATECGDPETNDTRQAVYLVRRVATSWGEGVIPVLYALVDGANNAFNVMDPTTLAPRQSYTALQRLMNLVAGLGGPGGSSASVPVFVGAPTTPWPIYAVGVYGANGSLLLVWQRTGCNESTTWDTIPTPSTYTAKFTLPAGYRLASAVDVVTGNTVPTSVSANALKVRAVGEDVQALTIQPGKP